MSPSRVEPVRKSVVVATGVVRAFVLFTNGFDAIFEPPHRVVFSWDIGPTWQLESDPSKTSEVEVRFIAEADDRTRVELEHRNLERHGTDWRAVGDAVDGDGGWPLYLRRYVELSTKELSR